jgi:hypothetical protein
MGRLGLELGLDLGLGLSMLPSSHPLSGLGILDWSRYKSDTLGHGSIVGSTNLSDRANF